MSMIVLTHEAWDYIKSMGADAAPLLDACRQVPLSQQEEVVHAWHENGIASAKAFEA